MLIYFDESYDNKKHWLILGACFHPHPKFLHRKMSEIKKAHQFFLRNGRMRELKYNICNNKKVFKIAIACIEAFFESTSYFRAIVIEQGAKWFDWDMFGRPGDPFKMKEAKMYKKFAELLLSNNVENIFNGTLLTDELTRCKGDRFISIMEEIFCTPMSHHSSNKNEPTFKKIIEVSSAEEQYQLLQITDLFIGAILNHLVKTKNRHKKKLANYICQKLNLKSLEKSTWISYSKEQLEEFFPKFNIWFWKPAKKA